MRYAALTLGLLGMLACVSCRLEEKQEAKPAAKPGMTIALVNSRDILTKCDAGRRTVSEIQEKFTDRRIRMALMEQDIRKLQDEVKGTDGKGPKAALLQTKLREFPALDQQFRQEVAKEEAEKFKPIIDLSNKIIREYALEKHLAGVQERGSFIYYEPAIDITEEIIKRINQAKESVSPN